MITDDQLPGLKDYLLSLTKKNKKKTQDCKSQIEYRSKNVLLFETSWKENLKHVHLQFRYEGLNGKFTAGRNSPHK